MREQRASRPLAVWGGATYHQSSYKIIPQQIVYYSKENKFGSREEGGKWILYIEFLGLFFFCYSFCHFIRLYYKSKNKDDQGMKTRDMQT